MKQIYLTNSEYELLLHLLNKIGAEYPEADDLADVMVYDGRVSEV